MTVYPWGHRKTSVAPIAVSAGAGSSLLTSGHRPLLLVLSYTSILEKVIKINKSSHSDCKSTLLWGEKIFKMYTHCGIIYRYPA